MTVFKTPNNVITLWTLYVTVMNVIYDGFERYIQSLWTRHNFSLSTEEGFYKRTPSENALL